MAPAPAEEDPSPVPGQVEALPARPAGAPDAVRVPGRAAAVPPPVDAPPAGAAPATKSKPEEPREAGAAAVSKSAPPKPASAAAKAPKTAAAAPAKPPAKTPAAKEPAVKNGPAAPGAARPSEATLDLKSLETRLRETDAIGVMTKLTLKSQVDDLLERFRAYHEGRAKTPLADLRQPYDSLILKVLALLQDKDPPLAGAIAASREAIWSILADGARFSKL